VVARTDLRRAELAYAAACTGEWACTVGLGVVAFRDGGPTTVGLVALSRMVPAALASPFVAALADRRRPEQLLVVASLVRAAALGAAAAVLAAGAAPFGAYVLAAVATVAFTVFRPVHSALLPLLCDTTRQLTSANVVRGIVDSAAALFGPLLAGALLGFSNPSTVFVAGAALSTGAGLALLQVRSSPVRRPGEPQRRALGRETVEGLRAVVQQRELATIFGLGFAQTIVRGALNVVIVVAAFGPLHGGDAGVAALAAAVGAGGLLGSLGVSMLVGSRHLGAWLAVALVLWGAPITLIGRGSLASACALLAIVGLGNAIIDVPLFTLPVRLAPDALLARVFGVFESLVALGVGLGSLLTPALVAATGLQVTLAVVGLLLPALSVASWRRLRRLDERLRVRDLEIAVLRRAPMLSPLPVPSIEHLASQVQHRTFAAGAVLFFQGDPGGSFAVIVDGRAEVIGDGTRVAVLGPGEAFGEVALLRDIPRTATVRACEELHVLEVERQAFLDAIGGSAASGDAARAVVARHLATFTPAGVTV
jgi:MFS family permease